MRLTRLVAGTVTAGLLSLAPVALTPAAQAVMTTNLEVSSSYKALPYGRTTGLTAAVRATESTTGQNGSVNVGTVQLQSKVTGSAWKTIKTATASGYLSFGQIKPKENTQFRITYSGGTDSYGNVFPAGVSGAVTVKVSRVITGKPVKGTFVMKGKVTPKFKNKKIIIKSSKKRNKGFKKVMTIRTNKKGRYKVRLPRRNGTVYYKFIVKKDKRFGGTTGTTSTWSY